jgi:TonB family protein
MSNVGRSVLCLLLAFACQAGLAPAVAASNEVKYEQALKLLKSGADNPHAVALFEEAALEGDIKALLMLGAILLEGKYVPQDRIKGVAYLQLVADADYPPYRPMRDQAQQWLQASQASMSGSELIKADQFAAQWNASYQRRLAADFAPALAVLTTETPLSYEPVIRFARDPLQLAAAPTTPGGPKFRSGCAAKARPGCPSASKVATEARCSGTIVTADTAPSSATADGALLIAPEYPVGVRQAGDSGTVKLLVHVDRSGWICGAVLAASSGTPSLDASALDTVGLWKLGPAQKGSTPVEALHTLAVTFRIQP